LFGLTMLILAYPLTFTVRAYAISGRDTRVHLAAGIGVSIVWAWIWTQILSWLKKLRVEWIGIAALSTVFTLQVGFGLMVQVDMIRAWNLQQQLWASILEAVPDLDDGTIILIDPDGLVDTWAIDSNTWAMPQVMHQLYQYPDAWENPPATHRLLPDWLERSLWNSQEIKAVDFQWQYVITNWERTVILETADNLVSKRLEAIEIGGERFPIKPFESQPPLLERAILYDYIIE